MIPNDLLLQLAGTAKVEILDDDARRLPKCKGTVL